MSASGAASGGRARAKGRGAVFFDRDGTLLAGLGYLDDPAQVELLPGATEAVRLANELGLVAVVVTNQSAIARGMLTEARLEEIHDRARRLLAEGGGRVDAVYYCPHHPSEGHPPYLGPCDCRKPAPGLLLRATREHGIDLDRSYLVGDQRADVLAARRAGVVPILVRTGWGGRAADAAGEPVGPPAGRPEELPEGGRPAYVASGVLEAILWIAARNAGEEAGPREVAGR